MRSNETELEYYLIIMEWKFNNFFSRINCILELIYFIETPKMMKFKEGLSNWWENTVIINKTLQSRMFKSLKNIENDIEIENRRKIIELFLLFERFCEYVSTTLLNIEISINEEARKKILINAVKSFPKNMSLIIIKSNTQGVVIINDREERFKRALNAVLSGKQAYSGIGEFKDSFTYDWLVFNPRKFSNAAEIHKLLLSWKASPLNIEISYI